MKKKAKKQIKVQKYTQTKNVKHLLIHPETIVFRVDLCFTADVLFFLFPHAISEMHRPIGAKCCIVVCSRQTLQNWVQKIGRPSPEKF